MTTIIVGTILVAICVLYGIASHRYARKDILLGVEAGPLQEDGVCHFPKYEVSSKAIRLMNGRYVNTRDYIRIVVHGNCMKPRNIQDGEEWLVEPLDKQKPLRSQIKEKDVSGAVAAIYVISRISGEGKDRRLEKGDYYLTIATDSHDAINNVIAVKQNQNNEGFTFTFIRCNIPSYII